MKKTTMRARVRRDRGAYLCEIEPHEGIVVGARSYDPVESVESAAAMAARLAADPLVQALLPPQVAAGLKVVQFAAAAVKRGDMQALVSKVGPKVARKALRVLRSIF